MAKNFGTMEACDPMATVEKMPAQVAVEQAAADRKAAFANTTWRSRGRAGSDTDCFTQRMAGIVNAYSHFRRHHV
jgi:hypothetical protein